MKYLIFDTSAFIPYFAGSLLNNSLYKKKSKRFMSFYSFIETMWLENKVLLLVPNIVITEFKRVISQKVILKGTKKEIEKYEGIVSKLVSNLEYKGGIYNFFFNLSFNRHHVIDFCKICERERIFMWRNRDEVTKRTLSYADMMVLAMCVEQKHMYKDDVILISADSLMCKFANTFGDLLPRACNPMEDDFYAILGEV